MAGELHRPGEEARIEQMQDRVLDAADILVDRQPVVDRRGIHRVLAAGIGEAREIPRGIDEGVEGVGLAPRRLAAGRAVHVLPGRMAVKRIARLVEGDVVGQQHRQVGGRHNAAAVAMDDRNRAAPVALAADQPVAQAEDRGRFAIALRLQPLADLALGILDGEAVEETGIVDRAVAGIGDVGDGEGLGIGLRRQHHRRHRQPVFAGEVEIALVMGGTAEDRAGAVFHQHEIGDVDRQGLARQEGMQGGDGGAIAALLLRPRSPLPRCRRRGIRR